MYSDRVKLGFVICVALLGGCKDHEVEKMAAVRDEVCACKTVQCAQDAMNKVGTSKVPSTTKTQKIAREMLDCFAELNETDRPSLDPDAPE